MVYSETMDSYFDFVSDELKDQFDFVPVIDDDTWYDIHFEESNQ
jgi:hypothetical protein